MKSVIEIQSEIRPCIHRYSGEHLLFHRWDSHNNIICEKESGELIAINWKLIVFVDNKHKEYDFTYRPPQKDGVEE